MSSFIATRLSYQSSSFSGFTPGGGFSLRRSQP
jgi:hypothetical protein